MQVTEQEELPAALTAAEGPGWAGGLRPARGDGEEGRAMPAAAAGPSTAMSEEKHRFMHKGKLIVGMMEKHNKERAL